MHATFDTIPVPVFEKTTFTTAPLLREATQATGLASTGGSGSCCR